FGGFLKGNEVSPSRMHAARPRVGRHVSLPIRLWNRMILVGCEVIPEIVEIDTLATLHQSFGGWPVEAEVPNVGVVINRLPSLHTRKESIHQDKLRHLRRKLRGIGI